MGKQVLDGGYFPQLMITGTDYIRYHTSAYGNPPRHLPLGFIMATGNQHHTLRYWQIFMQLR